MCADKLLEYIDERMAETESIQATADDFYNKITEIVKPSGEEPKIALTEAVFYLCVKYGCENVLTTAFNLNK